MGLWAIFLTTLVDHLIPGARHEVQTCLSNFQAKG